MDGTKKQKILSLYAQIDRLYEEISILEQGEGGFCGPRFEGVELLSDPFNGLLTSNKGKWVDAIPIFKNSYGSDFYIPGTDAYRKLSLDMYSELGMPDAPSRDDHSAAANEARQKRKDIRSTVHVYINRMRKYDGQ